MTCEDCIHYSVCFITDEDVEKKVEEFGCDDFKDKSRFIELPCADTEKPRVEEQGTCESAERRVNNVKKT